MHRGTQKKNGDLCDYSITGCEVQFGTASFGQKPCLPRKNTRAFVHMCRAHLPHYTASPTPLGTPEILCDLRCAKLWL